ncbi:hypothetical protein [Curtobacterium sp. MCSS17_016]|uniref:hypothetical protein n=1 Tax=Curtobacterium sp. MCSS17_016 TaxID=2175644 RepID=UPI000DA6DDC4|nr:hypothetical protein [Curtobacterium sp. MCSS17_016]WIE81219.1 hypothetical protein DEJ19_018470 [Curtobacterium sp. MCSS17_016]
MTTFNEHDHPRSTTGKFTEKRHDDAPDELGFYATERRVAVTLTLPDGTTDWDLAEVIDNAWPGADATTYGSFQDLRADVAAGAIRPDGTDGNFDAVNGAIHSPGKRVVALFNATSEDDRATITERLTEVFGDDSDITAYDEAADLFAAADRREVDDDGISIPNASRYAASTCAVCGKKPTCAVVYDNGSMWNGACGAAHAEQLSRDDSTVRNY